MLPPYPVAHDLAAPPARSLEAPVAGAPASPWFESPRGFRASLGSGVEVPFGRVDATRGALAARAPWLLEMNLALGYAMGRFYLGAYLDAGIGLANGGEPECAIYVCNYVQFKPGLDVAYTLSDTRVAPWIGYGVGWEIAQTKSGGVGIGANAGKDFTKVNVVYSGLEVARASVGVSLLKQGRPPQRTREKGARSTTPRCMAWSRSASASADFHDGAPCFAARRSSQPRKGRPSEMQAGARYALDGNVHCGCRW